VKSFFLFGLTFFDHPKENWKESYFVELKNREVLINDTKKTHTNDSFFDSSFFF